MLCLYPNVRGASREYRTDSGVANYQIPAEEGNSTVILESIVIRRTWCVRQRLLWLEEIFCSKKELIEISIRAEGGLQTDSPAGSEPKPEWNLLSHYTKQYLTRKISAGRKMDIITFFYSKIPQGSVLDDEAAVVRRAHSNRSLPPTLDALIPRSCIVFMDCIGKRRSAYREIPYGRHYSVLSLLV